MFTANFYEIFDLDTKLYAQTLNVIQILQSSR